MKATKMLKQLREKKGMVTLPGAYDCFSAKIIQKLGFDGIYLTGFGCEVSMLGRPDMGFTQMTEVADLCRRMYDATHLPIIVDADLAWGETLCVQRTVELLERAGAAGIHIEDQAMPMKCAGMPGLKYISKEAMVSKIKAALDAREDEDFLIIARSDVYAMSHDYQETLDRLYAYKEAGADMLIAGGEFSLDEFADMGKRFPYLTCINGGLYPFPNCDLPVEKWREMQIGLLFYPLVGLNAAGKAVQDALLQLQEGRISREYFQGHCFTLMETNGYVDYPYYMEQEKKFAVSEK